MFALYIILFALYVIHLMSVLLLLKLISFNFNAFQLNSQLNRQEHVADKMAQ